MKIMLGYLELASRPPSCMFHIAKGQAISILVVGQTRSELPPPLPGSMWLKPKANRVSRVYHYDHCPPVESGLCENVDSRCSLLSSLHGLESHKARGTEQGLRRLCIVQGSGMDPPSFLRKLLSEQ